MSAKKAFSEGDIFYTLSNNQYHLYKLLKVDAAFETYHVLTYQPLYQLPDKDQLNELKISIYHTPIAISGFDNPALFSKGFLTEDDFIGYYEYIKQTQNINELVAIAQKHYQHAYRLTDIKQHEAAIHQYSIAIELVPSFYEAIDNRAFCKMDLGKWNEAIEDFRLSLSINPQSSLAEFSIGECFFKSGNYKNAIKQFEKAIEIDPGDQLAKDFLRKAMALDRA